MYVNNYNISKAGVISSQISGHPKIHSEYTLTYKTRFYLNIKIKQYINFKNKRIGF